MRNIIFILSYTILVIALPFITHSMYYPNECLIIGKRYSEGYEIKGKVNGVIFPSYSIVVINAFHKKTIPIDRVEWLSVEVGQIYTSKYPLNLYQ